MSSVQELQKVTRDLLVSKQVTCVIGYEQGTHGRTRPVFLYDPPDAETLLWDKTCTHNLVTYLPAKLDSKDTRVGIIVKPCDSKAINVLLAEKKIDRDRVHIIGVTCEGILEGRDEGKLQDRCLACQLQTPVLYDTLIGSTEASSRTSVPHPVDQELEKLAKLSPVERAEFWLSQFDRCIRCYACRQACPMCDCPTCLFERDDSLWVGMGTGVNEKRTFHLGRAFHLAGRCIECGECERVCPMDIPISLLNRNLHNEMVRLFGHHTGMQSVPSPITTILNPEEA